MEELSGLLRLQIDRGGSAPLTVTGFSMLPMLANRRDRVYLTRLTHDPRRGDVILYRRENGQYVLHRVIYPEDLLGCQCCGDNSWTLELVHRTDILGIVHAFQRKGKDYTVRAPAYRLYSYLWTSLFPFRRPLIHSRRLLGRLKRTLRQKS